jgi:hypothetical protein
VKHPGIRDAIYLVKNGFTLDEAFALDGVKRTAFCIILQEHETGMKFNFNTHKFEPVK